MTTIREEAAFNLIIDCWEFHPGLNKCSFTPKKLVALEEHGIEVLSYTDSSVMFKLDRWRYYGARIYSPLGWEFETEYTDSWQTHRPIRDATV